MMRVYGYHAASGETGMMGVQEVRDERRRSARQNRQGSARSQINFLLSCKARDLLVKDTVTILIDQIVPAVFNDLKFSFLEQPTAKEVIESKKLIYTPFTQFGRKFHAIRFHIMRIFFT